MILYIFANFEKTSGIYSITPKTYHKLCGKKRNFLGACSFQLPSFSEKNGMNDDLIALCEKLLNQSVTSEVVFQTFRPVPTAAQAGSHGRAKILRTMATTSFFQSILSGSKNYFSLLYGCPWRPYPQLFLVNKNQSVTSQVVFQTFRPVPAAAQAGSYEHAKILRTMDVILHFCLFFWAPQASIHSTFGHIGFQNFCGGFPNPPVCAHHCTSRLARARRDFMHNGRNFTFNL